MKPEELKKWFNEEFWPLYQSFVKTPQPTKYKAGAKGEALKKVLRENPSKELRERVLMAIREQIRHRTGFYKKSGSMQRYNEVTVYQKFYSNRHAVTWWNQMGWEDEIPGSVEIEDFERGDRPVQKVCVNSECNLPSMGPKIDWCETHHPDTRGFEPLLKAKLKEMGLWKLKDETIEQWQMRCKADSVKKLKSMGMMK